MLLPSNNSRMACTLPTQQTLSPTLYRYGITPNQPPAIDQLVTVRTFVAAAAAPDKHGPIADGVCTHIPYNTKQYRNGAFGYPRIANVHWSSVEQQLRCARVHDH
jgi:hypothetical protein